VIPENEPGEDTGSSGHNEHDICDCGEPFAPIIVTNTAKSKAYRYYSERQIVNHVRSMRIGDLFRRAPSNEYHLRPSVKHQEDTVLILRPDNGKVVVITQMSPHFNHNENDEFQQASGDERHALKHGQEAGQGP